MKRLKVAKWFDDAGHAIGLWIAPEMDEVDDVMRAAESLGLRGDEDVAVAKAVEAFATRGGAQ